jgi:predicted RNase H-like HicB family nuclease
MVYRVEFEREKDGRWIAEIIDLPGVMAYGKTRAEALAHVKAIALRMLADEIERKQTRTPDTLTVSFATA